MFAYLKGSLEEKSINYVVVDCSGVGYKIFMSEKSIASLGELGEIVKIHTYLRVAEDDMSLFGFTSKEELKMFELLISVSGIGAKSAISILSNITPSEFALAVYSEDVSKLKSLPGVGPKSAQRIILELKDKVKAQNAEIKLEDLKSSISGEKTPYPDEALEALQILGYSRKEIDIALDGFSLVGLTTEEIIKKALQNLSR
jgi:Holliday junction DNA helicase RuvA